MALHFGPRTEIVYSFARDQSTNTGGPEATSLSNFTGGSIHDQMRGCLLNDNGTVNYYLNATNWNQKADGSPSDLSGNDGQVMVEIPRFFVASGSSATVWKTIISPLPLRGFEIHPAFVKDGIEVPYRYIGAYDASVQKTQAITGATQANPVVITANNHGLQTGDTCFISSVVGMTQINNRTFAVTRINANTFSLNSENGSGHTAYTSGGTFTAYIGGANLNDATALVDLTATTGSKLGSVSGVYPMVSLRRSEFRTLAANRGAGWRQLDYTLWSAVGILLAVEAQTLNSQAVYGNGNVSVSGGYPAGDADQTISPHSKSGKGNSIGNGSTDATSGASSATRDTAFCKYRGIENFWGNSLTWVDGINLYSEGNTAGNKVFAYWSNNRANFADVAFNAASTAIPAGFASLGEIANTLDNTRYATQFELINGWALVVKNFSSTSTHGTTDQYRTNSGWRALVVRGGAPTGVDAGAFLFRGDFDSNNRQRFIVARLAY